MRRAALLVVLLLAGAASAHDEEGRLDHRGRSRTYVAHVPEKRVRPSPLVVVLHGGLQTGKQFRGITRAGFDALADKDGFVVVYPDGVEQNWNDGRGVKGFRAQRDEVDDVGFLSSLVQALDEKHGIDRRRVYATGLSGGGMMAQRLALEAPDRVAAIAAVAGPIAAPIASRTMPTRAVPVLLIHGTKDPIVPWDGGAVALGFLKFGKVLSVQDTVAFWVKRNGGPKSALVEPLAHKGGDEKDATRVRRETWAGKKADVVLYAVEGGGHTWPSGEQYEPAMIVGATAQDVDACEVIWGFFKGKTSEPRVTPR